MKHDWTNKDSREFYCRNCGLTGMEAQRAGNPEECLVRTATGHEEAKDE